MLSFASNIRSATLFILHIVIIAFTACEQHRESTSSDTSSMATAADKFELTAGPCAAEGYFMTIHGGAFVGADGSVLPVPAGQTLEGDWAESGTVSDEGADQPRPAPERLKLLWFSYAENKFYEGDFQLPQARIQTLLQQGYWNTRENQLGTYNELVVCVLPKGAVVVWLAGGNQVLVGRFQGHGTQGNFQQYYGQADRATMVKETQQEMPDKVQEEIASGTISTKQWEAYLKTYPWQVAFNMPVTLYSSYNVQYVSGEYSNYPLTRDLAAYNQVLLTPVPKPVPTACYLHLAAEHGAHYQVRVKVFDEAETMTAFQALQAASPKSPITLLFTLDKPFQRATMVLKNDAREISLLKSQVEVFSEE
jgi:hypothetical protein